MSSSLHGNISNTFQVGVLAETCGLGIECIAIHYSLLITINSIINNSHNGCPGWHCKAMSFNISYVLPMTMMWGQKNIRIS